METEASLLALAKSIYCTILLTPTNSSSKSQLLIANEVTELRSEVDSAAEL